VNIVLIYLATIGGATKMEDIVRGVTGLAEHLSGLKSHGIPTQTHTDGCLTHQTGNYSVAFWAGSKLGRIPEPSYTYGLGLKVLMTRIKTVIIAW